MAGALRFCRPSPRSTNLLNHICELRIHQFRGVRGERSRVVRVDDFLSTDNVLGKSVPQRPQEPAKTKPTKQEIVADKKSKNLEAKLQLKAELDAIIKPRTNPDPDEIVTHENQHRKLAEVVTPLWEVPYDKQLQMKYQKTEHVLKTFADRAKQNGAYVHRRSNGLPCKLLPVRPSPVQEQYRNKDEFNVQVGVDGNSKTVGFYVGSWSKNNMVIVPGDQIIITKDSHKKVASSFEEYIRASPHPTCLKFVDGGVWRQIRVRSNDAGDLMAIVIVYPQDLTEASMLEEQEKLKEYFTNGPGKACNLKSLYFQPCMHTRCTHEQAPYRLIFGEPHLVESLNGLKFQISPDSFFQCNRRAAEVLYETIRHIPIKDPNVSILDLCCGTGAIGLTMAKQSKQVIGIEAINQSVIDARHNARINGINNIKFYSGEIETLVDDALKTMSNADVIAVVNPTRGGLNVSVIDALRQSKSVHQLIYISCQPEGRCMQDFERLCLPTSKRRGKPYMLRSAVPVDLFPHTYHCELVLLFEHMS